MKRIILTTLIVYSNLLSYAQFNLSGYIKNLPDGENLTVNVPFVFGYFDDDNKQLTVNKDGDFDSLLPLDKEKIGFLRWGSHEVFLWMRPGADLFVGLDGTNGHIALSGTMANANRLLYELELKKEPHFFTE